MRLEHKRASGFLDQPKETDPYRPLSDTLGVVAPEPADTREFMAEVAAEYDKK